jgi:undecaprenyl-diphosphatase
MIRRLLEVDAACSQKLRLADEDSRLFRTAALLAHTGDSWFWVPAIAVVWFFGGTTWRVPTALAELGVVALAMLVLAVKFTIRRRRPEGEWGAIYRSSDPHSFPSGHAARAAMLTVIAFGLGPLWVGSIMTVWAVLVSLARVATGVHYLSDIIAGLILGASFGWLMLVLQPILQNALPMLFTYDWLSLVKHLLSS